MVVDGSSTRVLLVATHQTSADISKLIPTYSNRTTRPQPSSSYFFLFPIPIRPNQI